MNFFRDIFGFLTTLTLIDYVFFFSVVILIILIVSLVYFIKINDEVFEESKNEDNKSLLSKKIEQIETPTPYIYDANEEGELLDLQAITKALEENKTLNVDLTEYEKDQEERAIISYEELLAKTSNKEINYEEEEIINDIQIKKVDLANLVNEVEAVPEPKIKVQVISYEREEAFLTALKALQQDLN